METQQNAKVTFSLPVELRRRLKIVAARKGASVQEIMLKLTEAYVEKREAEASE